MSVEKRMSLVEEATRQLQGDRMTAEDVVQTTFLKLLIRFPLITHRPALITQHSSLIALVRTTMFNILRDLWRRRRHEQEYERQPSNEELAEMIDIPKDKISDTLRVGSRHVSVDAPFVEGEDNSLLDVLPNDDSPSADRTLVNESLNTEIERALSTLTDREREIIKSFFGIGCQEMTLEEIGERFGLTRERVRQIKEKAIRRLKSPSRSKLLKSYLG